MQNEYYLRIDHHQDPSRVLALCNEVCNRAAEPFYVMEESESALLVSVDTEERLQSIAESFLELYSTLGMDQEEDNEVDIFELSMYFSSPCVSSFFFSHRLNMDNDTHNALSDIISSQSSEIERLQRAVNQIDGLILLNGGYKMRQVLQVICESMEHAGIAVADKINKVMTETTH